MKRIDEYEEPTECEFYKEGFCRITGGACPHYAETYEICPTRRRASTRADAVRPVLDDSVSFEDLMNSLRD